MDTLANLRLENLTSTNGEMARCLKLAALAAKSDVPVLILGETGTGKTLLGRAIHNSSARSAWPFISFNASAMTDTLLESQLFGHERGAFTGADKAVKGKFELADKGTLFLDELADMSLLAQAKILRAVEYGEFERLGSERMLRSNARVISATNCPLREKIREGKFREDLFHRLNGLTLVIPALRDRADELPALIAEELKASAFAAGKKIAAIHPGAMEKLLAHEWRGNLRELKHMVQTMALFCEGPVILPEHVVFPPDLDSVQPGAIDRKPREACASKTLQGLALSGAVERHIRFVYEQNKGNQRQTAKHLGISRATLARHLRKMDQN
jgi:transcriptional regulator with PAS, ATPase and Fis domain